ncbi:hypothetical protein [Corynebacterium aurimucosum]|uniref:Putative membrane protein n=1 Tax=Corynebacterium aurimucosum (strain ATCC 700975 / DSM 44827 / CIP 107346 / CN-1) TaxID=548476 RepID=C3PH33_CORA7|nr:hypothetical protein [Corynebacterium aurimucosum]ACP33137.1 putative membrane protein [Corynebacterium aurimucosum ATCC 700975]QQU92732.1 hypothetical protein I6I67_10980 [Corynebacterium aurimucosum]
MRIRNAAIAGATALAVTFGGSTVAFAEDTNSSAQENTSPSSQENSNSSASKEGAKGEASLSSKIGDTWFNKGENDNKTTEADGRAIFGSSKHENCDANETKEECTRLSDQPTWAKAFYGLGIASAIASVAGFIGVVYNFFVHGPSF